MKRLIPFSTPSWDKATPLKALPRTYDITFCILYCPVTPARSTTLGDVR